jgi:hypothetical protein
LGKRRAIALGVLSPTILVLIAAFWGPLITLASLKQVDDHPLYVMRYYGPYRSDLFVRTELEEAIYDRVRRMALPEACTCFAGLSPESEKIFGRNFDWHDHPALLLFTDPPNGYVSVSMVDIYYLGYQAGRDPKFDRAALLLAPYLPFDGMNEAGLAVGMMAVPHAEDAQEPDQVTIDSLRAIRVLLDYADSTDEAISLLQEYNIVFPETPIHYLISDASGSSVVVEFIDGEMHVIDNDEPWQVATNFLMTEVDPQGASSPCERYNAAYQTLATAGGRVSESEAMAILEEVSAPHTIWSAVYNLTTGDVAIVMDRDYAQVIPFRLEMIGATPE